MVACCCTFITRVYTGLKLLVCHLVVLESETTGNRKNGAVIPPTSIGTLRAFPPMRKPADK